MTESHNVWQELAAAFDHHGDVIWHQGSNTTTQMSFTGLDDGLAFWLRQNYGGTLIKRVKAGGYNWKGGGAVADRVAQDILPYVERRQAVLSLFVEARKMLIASSKRGRGSRLSDEERTLRQSISQEINRLRAEVRNGAES